MKKIFHRQHTYLALFIMSFLVYVNTLNHEYVLDDFSVIKDNFVVKKGVDGIPEIFKTHYRYGYGFQTANLYRPLTLSLFAIQWEIAPNNPAFAHFFNVLFYSLLVLIIYHFLLQLFGENKMWFAFIASALFCLHPLHTEVVANIKSVDEILVFGFALGSMLSLFKYMESHQKKHLLISLLLFGTGFFAKESMVTFLAIIPLTLFLFKKQSIARSIKLTTWFLIPFAIYMISRIQVLGSLSGNKSIAVIDNMLLAAPNEAVKLATAIKIMGMYLWKMIFPHPLMNDYSLSQIPFSSFTDWEVWLSILIHFSLIYLFLKTIKTNKIIAFAIGFYLIGIVLYSNILFTIGTSFGERLLFIPSLSFCLILSYLILIPFQKELQLNKFWKSGSKPLLIAGLIGLLYAFKTTERNKAWKDNFTLYSTDVKNCSNSARCQYYYGLGLMKEKALNTENQAEKNRLIQASIQAFTKAIEIHPTYSDAYGQRGLAYYRLNQFPAALSDYQKAAQYNPGNATALSNMGSLYFQQKQYQEAKKAFERALRANPNHVDALANYASTLGTLGDYNTAITYFKRAAALKPNEPSYYQMIGMTYKNLGNQQMANRYFQKAQALRNN